MKTQRTTWIMRTALLAALLGLNAACGMFGPSQPTTTVRKWVEIKPSINFQSPVTKSGVTIEVKAIHPGNKDSFPKLRGAWNWTKYPPAEYNIAPENGSTDYCILGDLPMAFELKVTNKTGHVMRFTGAVIKLIDAAGNMHEPMDKDDISSEWTKIIGKESKDGIFTKKITNVDPMIDSIKKLKVIDNNTDILPDYTTEGYLIFGPLKSPEEMKSLTQVKLAIYDLVTETDAAGNPKAKQSFEWSFDIAEQQETVQGQ